MAGKDYYKILGVNKNATERELKQAYRRLARKHHPDVNPGDNSAEAKFKEINTAFEVLSNNDKREKYDQYGDQWQYADQFAQAGKQQSPFRDFDFNRAGGSTSYNFGEGDLGSLFDDLFGGSRTGTYRRKAGPRRGQDIEYPVEVTLEEAYHGASRLLSLAVEEPCSACQGAGRIQNVPCSACKCSGIVSRVKRLEIKIPLGVKNGSRVRLAGKGGQGYSGGSSGDLYLIVSVKPHRLFERKGDDLHVELAVPLAVAILGGEFQVPTLKGKLALKIPPETQNGRVFRLSGQGMPYLGNPSRGDLLAKVNVVLPTKLSAEEKKLFEQFQQLRSSS